MQVYERQNEEVRLLAYKLLIDSFNVKYKGLDDKQKILIREYINNISNTNSLRQYINQEIPVVRTEINELKARVGNEIVRIKLDETLNQLDKISKGTLVKESQITALMLSYELIKELKNLK
jgi:vacuolar-type H+-ATPase subunit D/Vma8